MNLQDAQQVIQSKYKVELLGLSPFQFSGENPDSFVAFWRSEEKQPAGQYTVCIIRKDKIEHRGNFEERFQAQETFCQLTYPYQR